MAGFLLDANVSPDTAAFLQNELLLDAVHWATLKRMHLSDVDIIRLATALDRVIITFDLDFGRLFQHSKPPSFGVVLLRLSDQTVESTNRALRGFFSSVPDLETLRHALAIIDDRRVRLVH